MTPPADQSYLVVDSSVAFKWFCSAEESSVDEALELLAAHAQGRLRLVAPAHLPAEVLNALAHRSGVHRAQLALAAEGLAEAELVYPAWDAALLSDAAVIARAHRLTYYDALFPALAIQLGCGLVTADRGQARVRECAVRVLL
jgi:predicted nucleic acid-binding protein